MGLRPKIVTRPIWGWQSNNPGDATICRVRLCKGKPVPQLSYPQTELVLSRQEHDQMRWSELHPAGIFPPIRRITQRSIQSGHNYSSKNQSEGFKNLSRMRPDLLRNQRANRACQSQWWQRGCLKQAETGPNRLSQSQPSQLVMTTLYAWWIHEEK